MGKIDKCKKCGKRNATNFFCLTCSDYINPFCSNCHNVSDKHTKGNIAINIGIIEKLSNKEALSCPVCSSRRMNICRTTGFYRCRECGYSQQEEDKQNIDELEAEAEWIAEQEAKGRAEEMEKCEEEQAYLAGGGEEH